MSLHPANAVCIGEDTWPDPDLGQCGYCEVTYKIALKADKKESDGKSDATVTVKGKKPPDLELTVHWIDDTMDGEDGGESPINDRMMELLEKWSPRGENYGKPFEWTHIDQGPANVHAVLFEELDGPKREAGKATAKFKLTSWNKPVAKAKAKDDDTKTPDEADKWDKDANGKSVTNPTDKAGKGGFGGDNKPAVKP